MTLFNKKSAPEASGAPTIEHDTLAARLVQRLTLVAVSLSLEKDKDRVLEMILQEARDISRADGGTLYYLNEDNELEFSIAHTESLNITFGGSTGKKPPFMPLKLYNPETGEPNYSIQAVFAVLNKTTVNIPDVYDADGFDFTGTKKFDQQYNYQTRSVITVPMVNHKNEVMGCLQLVNAKDPKTGEFVPFTPEIQQIIEALASMAAVIVDNKQLIEAQEELLDSFIKVIAKAIDAKSPYTGAHCERVPALTMMLADAGCKADYDIFKKFNLNEDQRYELHVASWLHDCGKVVTPVHIMDKATKLETINDRIAQVQTRWEVLKRDAKIEYLEKLQQQGADKKALETEYNNKVKELEDELEFLETINIGGEFLADEKLERLKQIAAREWNYKNGKAPLLSEDELYNLSIRKGTITDEERKMMNDHMVHTCNMLEELPFPKHLQNVPEYAGGHHERMDGKGYPKGLLAGEMSIPARMMAVADVFEALTASDRPYKDAKKLSETMRIIGIMKKTNHLDPKIVDLFIRSKVYLEYAYKYLDHSLIDEIDEQGLLDIVPEPIKQ